MKLTRQQLGAYLQMAKSTIRYEGPLALAIRIVRLALRRFGSLSIVTFLSKDLTAPIEAPDARVAIDIHRLPDAHGDRLIPLVVESSSTARRRWKVMSVERAENRVRKRLDGGAICFVATHEGDIVHYNWLFPGIEWPMTPTAFVPTTPSEIMVDDAYTTEEWRGSGIHAAVHAQILQFAQTSGYTSSFARLDTENRSSRKALTRLGYSRYGTAIIFKRRRSGRMRMIRFGRPPTPFRLC